MDFFGDMLYAAGGMVIMFVIYVVWICTFGTAKYRRWARESRKN